MFGWWGQAVVRARWWVLAASAVLVVIGGTWGVGVFGSLSGGGFDDPASESSHAATRINILFMGFSNDRRDCPARCNFAFENCRAPFRKQSTASWGTPNAPHSEFSGRPGLSVASAPSCAAAPVVAQWRSSRHQVPNILF